MNITNNELLPEQQEIDEKWMRVALDLAREAVALGEVPVGAVAVKNGQIVGRGFNMKEAQQDPTAHAEMIALRETAVSVQNWRLLDVTLYCTLEPCPMCAAAHAWVGLGRIVFVASSAQISAWRAAAGAAPSAVAALPISVVAPGVLVDGPAEGLVDEVRVLIEREAARA